MTKRGRTNGALDAINSQRKARAELVAQRQREAEILTGLKVEQAGRGQGPRGRGRSRPDHVRGAAPRRHDRAAIRWLILAMVLCCDPLAIALTAAASARR